MALKDAVDEAVADQPTVNNVLVVRRTGIDVDWTEVATCGGTRPWKRPPHHVPEAFDSEQLLFLLYTSGTTGKPRASCTAGAT